MPDWKVNDRIIMTNVDPTDETLEAGDYGRVIEVHYDQYTKTVNRLIVKFKRALDPDGDDTEGVWGVELHEIMKCEKGMTWEQIRMIADVLKGT